jgi:hypothetical protein
MPISSGANDWPKEYFAKPQPNPPSAKVVVSRPQSPIVARPAPRTTKQVTYIDQGPNARPPSPQRIVVVDQAEPQTTVVHHQQGPPPIMSPPPPFMESGYGMRRYPPGYGGYNDYGRGGCTDPNCCADPYFTTGVSGANAGCCQGGMFGSRVSKPSTLSVLSRVP